MDGDTFSSALRRWRTTRRLSLRELAARTHYGKSLISDLENDVRRPHPEVAAQLDQVLQTGGELSILLEQANAARQLRVRRSVPYDPYHYTDLARDLLTAGRGGIDDMQRRTFMLDLTGLTGLGVAAPALALEAARHGLSLSLAEDRAGVAVGEWQEIVEEYGYRYTSTPAAELLPALLADVLAIQYAMQRRPDDATVRQLQRSGALLAAIMAMAVANLGQLHEAQRWWRSARRVADESADPATIAWVRGREVIRALYEQRPVPSILKFAEQATALSKDAPPAKVRELISGHAQALSAVGRAEEAQALLRQVQEIDDRLPAETIPRSASIFGWSEDCLRFTESYVYSHLGAMRQADEAQSRALALYAANDHRGPAQIELQRALCMVHNGAIDEAVQHAHRIIEDLAAGDRIRPVVALGHEVLDLIPAQSRQRGAVQQFREFLTSPTSV